MPSISVRALSGALVWGPKDVEESTTCGELQQRVALALQQPVQLVAEDVLLEGEKAVGEVLKTEAELTMLHSRPRPLPGLYVCELNNHRVMRYAGTGGEVVVGGFGRGSAPGQLAGPRKLCADEEFLYLSELGNRRVTRWVPSLRGQAAGCEVLTGHLEEPWGICVDRAAVYVADAKAHAVTRWVQRKGTVEAGGRGPGDGLDQLNQPVDVALDSRGRLYVAERGNDRVTRWHGRNCEIVAGGQGWGDDLEQLAGPTALALQEVGGETAVLVAEAGNNRITRWWPGQPRCEILIGGVGSLPNLDAPEGLHYDAQEGCIYVAEAGSNRVTRWRSGALQGEIIAGGKGRGDGLQQMNGSCAVLLIAENGKRAECALLRLSSHGAESVSQSP
ncbi:unnamed protein product [Effrenium voratum]|nr:unnamed protein product [Effrenium voratum]